MNVWKIIAYLCVAGVLVVAVLWLADGTQIYTKTGRQEVTKDEMWGTEEIKWIPDFQLGLLPSTPSISREAISALPIAGVLVVVAATSLWMSKRNRVPRL